MTEAGEGSAPRDPARLASVGDDLVALYAEVDEVVARHRPVCDVSGRCCRFDEVDHELWATELEIAHAVSVAGGVPEASAGLCPWHVEGLCTLRDGRPLGCRTYFCDPAWAQTGPEVHELFHRRLGALHEKHGAVYGYRRFVDAVRDVPPPGGDAPPAGDPVMPSAGGAP